MSLCYYSTGSLLERDTWIINDKKVARARIAGLLALMSPENWISGGYKVPV